MINTMTSRYMQSPPSTRPWPSLLHRAPHWYVRDFWNSNYKGSVFVLWKTHPHARTHARKHASKHAHNQFGFFFLTGRSGEWKRWATQKERQASGGKRKEGPTWLKTQGKSFVQTTFDTSRKHIAILRVLMQYLSNFKGWVLWTAKKFRTSSEL